MDKQRYKELRNKISLQKISLGYRELKLFSVAELEEAQIGFSVSETNENLTGILEDDWKDSWLVIGVDVLLGDPVFTDLTGEKLPVYTATIGEGSWNPVMIAPSFDMFIQYLEYIQIISKDRQNPVELESNPVSDLERDELLRQITRNNENVSLEFWEDWFEI